MDHSGSQVEDADIDEDLGRLEAGMGRLTFETAFTRGMALSPRESLRTALQWAQEEEAS
jgi:hypothetical protein